MYNLIVASISKKNFEAVNNKDFNAVLKQCDLPRIRTTLTDHPTATMAFISSA
jgi:hypothetical protein